MFDDRKYCRLSLIWLSELRSPRYTGRFVLPRISSLIITAQHSPGHLAVAYTAWSVLDQIFNVILYV